MTKAIEEFEKELANLVRTAVQAGVPLENIILALDLKHADAITMRQSIIAQRAAREMSSRIVPPSGN